MMVRASLWWSEPQLWSKHRVQNWNELKLG